MKVRFKALASALIIGWSACPVRVPAETVKPARREQPDPVKVLVLAGDENVRDLGVIEGRTDGVHEDFFVKATPARVLRGDVSAACTGKCRFLAGHGDAAYNVTPVWEGAPGKPNAGIGKAFAEAMLALRENAS